jgi:hypothetical protein
MTNCTQSSFEFPALNRKKIEAEFSGGAITSDAGALLLRDVDRQLGLLETVDRIIPDPRDSRYTTHSQLSLLRQRVYGLCLGYEDLNDHNDLRGDVGFQTSVNSESDLGSPSTLCRLENRCDRSTMFDLHRVMVNTFMASFDESPEELILDIDATDDLVHGEQEGRFFHGYYRQYCFLPLYVFCGDQLLVSYLRPSNIDGAKHTWAILSLLVKRFRQQWPQVNIIVRGDGGFCRQPMLNWCERHDVGYIVGYTKNKRLLDHIKTEMKDAEKLYEQTQQAARLFKDIRYGAKSWKRQRHIIAKVEHLPKGSNARFIVTNLNGDAQYLYEEVYCARGEMENRIKEQQLGLFSDRTSCHDWWANQYRLLLSSLAYILMETIRRTGLKNTSLARAQVNTIRLQLFKIGAVIIRNTRRIRFLLSSHYPRQTLFMLVARRLQSG